MGNCTHKTTKNKPKATLKCKMENKYGKDQRSNRDIFDDLTPSRKNNQSSFPTIKPSQFNLQHNQDLQGDGCNTTPSNQHKSDYFKQEKTTASSINIKDNYKFLRVIGEGSFGKVRLAQNQNGKKFAIKSILKADANERFYLLRRELDIIKKIDHPNLVKFYETYHDEKYLHIVMEYVEGVELSVFCAERFSAGRRFTEIEVAFIIRKLLSALSHMHRLNIIHRDLKPENIMINEQNLDIKILDFGLSRDFSSGICELQSIVGTPLYVAPEVIKEGPYNEKCDVWSVGVLMYYLLSGKQAFEGCSIKDLFQKIYIGHIKYNENVWNDISQDAKFLINQLLTVNVEQRLSSEQALSDSWFSLLLKRQQNQKTRNMKRCLSKIQNIISFQNTHRFKQEIIRVMFSTQTQSEEIEKLKMAFETIDSDDNGFITAQEMFKATQQLKIPISMSQIHSLFHEINGIKSISAFKRSDELDVNPENIPDEALEQQKINIYSDQNCIHYSDFIFAAINLSKELDESKIKQIFDHFDKDCDNFISIEDMENTLAQEGRKIPQLIVKQMIEEVDTDGDCKISYQEFIQIIQTEIEIFQKTRTSFTNLEI